MTNELKTDALQRVLHPENPAYRDADVQAARAELAVLLGEN